LINANLQSIKNASQLWGVFYGGCFVDSKPNDLIPSLNQAHLTGRND
jgi:hypothetical protein